MKRAAHQFMYLNLAAILLAVFFVLQPAQDPDTAAFQEDVKIQVLTAAKQLWGEGSPTESLALVWNGLTAFYNTSADQTIALITPSERVVEMVLAFNSNYHVSKQIAMSPMVIRPPQEPPLFNIIPMSVAEAAIDPFFNDDLAYSSDLSGRVAGESIGFDEEISSYAGQNEILEPRKASWITLNDSITGAEYCVAVFNGELNSYAGPCAKEDEQVYIYEN